MVLGLVVKLVMLLVMVLVLVQVLVPVLEPMLVLELQRLLVLFSFCADAGFSACAGFCDGAGAVPRDDLDSEA